MFLRPASMPTRQPFNSIENKAFVTTDSYSINGQRTNSNHRGLTIQRTNDGQTRKVIVR